MDKDFYTFNEYMKKKDDLTASEEDYIEMIYRLCIKDNYTRVSDLASSLNVKPPSASCMLKRLVEKDYITHIDYGIIQLTELGQKTGKVLYERHYIIEEFLKILKVEENLLEEVEKIEHTLSKKTVASLKYLVFYLKENQTVLKDFYKYCSNLNEKKQD